MAAHGRSPGHAICRPWDLRSKVIIGSLIHVSENRLVYIQVESMMESIYAKLSHREDDQARIIKIHFGILVLFFVETLLKSRSPCRSGRFQPREMAKTQLIPKWPNTNSAGQILGISPSSSTMSRTSIIALRGLWVWMIGGSIQSINVE